MQPAFLAQMASTMRCTRYENADGKGNWADTDLAFTAMGRFCDWY